MQQTPFQRLLTIYRDNSKTEREKGSYFERLVIKFLTNDERYCSQFTKVQTYTKWARENGISGNDIGIDLVASNSEEYGGGYSAIQCKFFDIHPALKGEDSYVANPRAS